MVSREFNLCWGLQEKSTRSNLHRDRQERRLVASARLIEAALNFCSTMAGVWSRACRGGLAQRAQCAQGGRASGLVTYAPHPAQGVSGSMRMAPRPFGCAWDGMSGGLWARRGGAGIFAWPRPVGEVHRGAMGAGPRYLPFLVFSPEM